MLLKIFTNIGIWLLVAGLFLVSCQQTPNPFNDTRNSISLTIAEGSFSSADTLITEAQRIANLSVEDQRWLEVQQATIDRIRIDFDTDESEVKGYLSTYYPDLTDLMMERWESTGVLEMKWVDGEKRYFGLAARNLFRIDKEAHQVWLTHHPSSIPASTKFNVDHASRVIAASLNSIPVLKEKFGITFTVRLKPGIVPAGELVRCWMPYPRESPPRQAEIRLSGVNESTYSIAGQGAMQRSLYLEKRSAGDQPTIFEYNLTYQSSAQWFDPTEIRAKPYHTGSKLYQKHTREQPPHVVFSKAVTTLADSLAGIEKNPLELVRRFYYWIDANIPWASALEYSIMDCIPDYVLKYRHGDCGMQTFLFMSLCRYKGIPVKWQSGWHVHPGNKNLHDWCEVYYEGTGWVPVDVSFGLLPSDDPRIRDFYITGIDAYRLIVNDDISSVFSPQKKFYRSEPYDFQRGELEWKEGNLYFNDWNYAMAITYEKIY